MIHPGEYFLLLRFIQISFEHDKDKGLLEAGVDLLKGEAATAWLLWGAT